MSARRSQRRRRRPRRAKDRRRWRRAGRLVWRVSIRLLPIALVTAIALFLYLDFRIAQRFEGRLWRLPSRVYSDLGVLARGDLYPPETLLERLRRNGYARTDSRELRPGQFTWSAQTLVVRTRAFRSPVGSGDEGTVVARFAGDRLVSLRDGDGRRLRRWLLEPEPLAAFYGARQEERDVLPLDAFPETLVDAVLVAEDARFYRHHGLDLRGIARAAWTNTRRGSIVQGGSTITQQTVKNLFLDSRRTLGRKLREAAMAIVLDARYEKDRILEVYLNEVYLGQRGPVSVCGFQAAARHYFGRDVGSLSLAEAATLAGLVRSPGNHDPHRDPEAARARRDRVLDAMLARGRIDEARHAAAVAEPLRPAGRAVTPLRAAYAVEYLRTQLVERYGRTALEEDGLAIYTTLDTRAQAAAERALREGLERLDARAPGLQGAVVVTEPERGAIVALVGGRDFGASQFNRAVQARRQPGSCFKPFVFAAGLEHARRGLPGGLRPGTRLEDRPIRWETDGKSWAPANYDRSFRGRVTVRRTLVESLNVPTVRAAQAIGIEEVARTAARCGVVSPLDPVPSLALGTAEVTPLELATAYGTFANGGRRIDPWLIQAVQDGDGNLLEGRSPTARRAIAETTAYQITDMLRGVLDEGTGRSARALGYHGDAAGKTGTTDETRDAWFVGYDDRRLALVWVGHDDNRRTGLTGATGALPIWVELMRAFEAGDVDQHVPRDMVRIEIDPDTGGRATRRCPNREEQLVPRDAVPERCGEHQGRMRRWLRRWFGEDDGTV